MRSSKLYFNILKFLLIGIALLGNTLNTGSSTYPVLQLNNIRSSLAPAVLPDSITLIGTGDIMLGTNYPGPQFLPPAFSEDLLAPVRDIMTNAHLTFGNMEGAILDDGGKVKKCSNPKACYAFRMPERLALYLQKSGLDVMSLANNHSGDFGKEGRENTVRVLDSLGIANCGLEVKPSVIVEREGIRFGIIAFAPNSGTLRINDIPAAKALVQELKKQCDMVVVSFHGGAEGRSHQHVTRKTEMFYGEDRGNVYEFAHAVIDAGADVVFGHGPHVPRALDLYRGRFIAYSMGNFCTYGRFSLSGEAGLAPIIKVYTSSQGRFLKARIYSFQQLGEGGPVPDPNERAFKKIKDLTEQDMPEAPLRFEDGGEVFLK